MDGHFPTRRPSIAKVMQITRLILIVLDWHVRNAQAKILMELVLTFHWLPSTQIITTNTLAAIHHVDYLHTTIGEIHILKEILHHKLQQTNIAAQEPMILLKLAGKDQIHTWPIPKLCMPTVIPTHGHMTMLLDLRPAVPRTLLLL